MKWVAVTMLPIACGATLSWANSILTPGSILADPQSYQSQVVRVTGVVAHHKIRRRGAHRCFQSFTVKDRTGSIAAVQRANCAGVKNALRNRDMVTVEALFEWSPGKPGWLNVQAILAKVAPSAG